MASDLVQKGKKLAKTCALVQICISVTLIVIVSLINIEYTIAVVAGCIAFVLPQSVFAWFAFKYSGATKTNLINKSFNQGLKLKLMLTTVIFAIAFSKLNAHPLPLLGAYVVVMVSNWLTQVSLRERS